MLVSFICMHSFQTVYIRSLSYFLNESFEERRTCPTSGNPPLRIQIPHHTTPKIISGLQG